MLSSHTLTSDLLGESRQLWLQSASAEGGRNALLILDAELYIDRVKLPEILHEWQVAGGHAVTAVYVSLKDSTARHANFTCSEPYVRFLVHEVLPWIEQTAGRFERLYLIGLSLSGLQALFTAVQYPRVFAGVLAQSPSAWWNEEWLAASLATVPEMCGRFWISVGEQEVQKDLSHPPSGMMQSVTQLDSVRRLSGKLASLGHEIHHNEFKGGHDPICWGHEMPVALNWLLGA